MRYFSVEYGPKAFVPEPEDSVYKRRQSDCKSNAVIVINKLRRQGINALPALVHTYLSDRIDHPIPSFTAFNHLIVYAPDYDWWIDPTYGKNPIWMKPPNVAGSAALLLYNDSAAIKHIPYNADNNGIDTFSYTYEINDKTVKCTVKNAKSYSSSFVFLNWIASLNKKDIASTIVRSNLDVDSGKVSNVSYSLSTIGTDKKRVIVTKNYTLTDAYKKIGGSYLFEWPETPVYPDDYLNDNTDSSSIETNDDIFDFTFHFSFITDKKVSWMDLSECNNDLFGLKIIKKDNNNLSFRVFVKSGVVETRSRIAYNKMLNSLGEFFNSELILN